MIMAYTSEDNYFDSTSVNQVAYDELFAQLVPERGEADTLDGEALRTAGRIYYDWFNNGFWNITATHYQEMISFLHSQASKFNIAQELDVVDEVVEEIESDGGYDIEFEEYSHLSNALETMLDKIVLKLS
ncbi:hypothetical protein WK78_26375 [Burkholderia cepacia]|nr:hypothetical protein WK78_26375 [Burkholderia cepacia]